MSPPTEPSLCYQTGGWPVGDFFLQLRWQRTLTTPLLRVSGFGGRSRCRRDGWAVRLELLRLGYRSSTTGTVRLGCDGRAEPELKNAQRQPACCCLIVTRKPTTCTAMHLFWYFFMWCDWLLLARTVSHMVQNSDMEYYPVGCARLVLVQTMLPLICHKICVHLKVHVRPRTKMYLKQLVRGTPYVPILLIFFSTLTDNNGIFINIC